jgi:hypothetical protein
MNVNEIEKSYKLIRKIKKIESVVKNIDSILINLVDQNYKVEEFLIKYSSTESKSEENPSGNKKLDRPLSNVLDLEDSSFRLIFPMGLKIPEMKMDEDESKSIELKLAGDEYILILNEVLKFKKDEKSRLIRELNLMGISYE